MNAFIYVALFYWIVNVVVIISISNTHNDWAMTTKQFIWMALVECLKPKQYFNNKFQVQSQQKLL